RPNPNSVASKFAPPPIPSGVWSQPTNDGASRPTVAPTIPPATPDTSVQAITETIACVRRIIATPSGSPSRNGVLPETPVARLRRSADGSSSLDTTILDDQNSTGQTPTCEPTL